MQELLTPSPKLDHGMGELLTPPPKPMSGLVMWETPPPSPSSEPRQESGMRGTHSPSPVPSHHSDLRIQEPPSPEFQDDTRMQMAPSPEPQGSSSTSGTGREFHITSSYLNLPLIPAGWKWGKKAPPPIIGQPNTVGEVERRDTSVCQAVHMLESRLIHACSRIIPRPMG